MSKSAVCSFFEIDESDQSKAVCKLCSSKISRGGTNSSAYNTSNLIKHLKNRHNADYQKFTKASHRLSQPTLPQTLSRREKMLRDNPRAVKISAALTQFIALDDQPLSVLDNVGFRRLLNILEPRYEIPSRNYITDTAIPQLYDFVKEHVSSLLKDISAISFTCYFVMLFLFFIVKLYFCQAFGNLLQSVKKYTSDDNKRNSN